MKKKYFAMISVLLCCVMFYAMILPAYADGHILGTADEITGYLLPENEDQAEGRGEVSPTDMRVVVLPVQPGDLALNEYTEIFTITATQVTYLLPSSVGGKSFTLNDLPSRAVNIF